jgi:hypothetical protein
LTDQPAAFPEVTVDHRIPDDEIHLVSGDSRTVIHVGPASTMSVRDAARRLGVHENTIRNWMGSGDLAFEPKPGPSGYRRPLTASVERMAAKRAAADEDPERVVFGQVHTITGLELLGSYVSSGDQLEHIRARLERKLGDAVDARGGLFSSQRVRYEIRATYTATVPKRAEVEG